MDVVLTTGDESKKLSVEAPVTASEPNPSYPTVTVSLQTVKRFDIYRLYHINDSVVTGHTCRKEN